MFKRLPRRGLNGTQAVPHNAHCRNRHRLTPPELLFRRQRWQLALWRCSEKVGLVCQSQGTRFGKEQSCLLFFALLADVPTTHRHGQVVRDAAVVTPVLGESKMQFTSEGI
jgi:hypothetical protein